MLVRDSVGNILENGDSVTLIKDLKLKGSSSTLKRGLVVKNIRLTNKDGEIEAKVDKHGQIVLKTEFLKKN